jgi:hypothetical protein
MAWRSLGNGGCIELRLWLVRRMYDGAADSTLVSDFLVRLNGGEVISGFILPCGRTGHNGAAKQVE